MLELMDQLTTLRHLLTASFMAAQQIDDDEQRSGLSSLLLIITNKLRDAEALLAQLHAGNSE